MEYSYMSTTSPHPLPPIPPSDLSANLVPRPLFTPRTRSSKRPHPPLSIAVAVIDASGRRATHSSPTSTSSSSVSSSPSTSPPSFNFDYFTSPSSEGPPPYTALSPSWSQPPPPYQYQFQSSWPSSPTSSTFSSSSFSSSVRSTFSGPHLLRRKPSPKQLSLRALRAKESDACLQRIYERQTMAYLDGTVFGSVPRRSGLRRGIMQGD
ncbi:uncharacterized protein BDZ99DRAFT_522354 [Mytilinidion resinicola]|uniref:Uncharacterized protein n=1 Tax=Mytilinidion resinicola TaxID=574789 RepID=A0A6A6YFY8_9PEZI|nr:uncharacterized protein BDZ99DRAFT_522354 [Mytilinidion resinicola]KAF2807736.1 hypothetical protein BDZ99DRAFT_522354 [Mytilinidion resinicola]